MTVETACRSWLCDQGLDRGAGWIGFEGQRGIPPEIENVEMDVLDQKTNLLSALC